MAPIPYFSIVNVHLVDINVFAKLDEIPSFPLQVIKEKPKCCGLTIQRAVTLNELAPSPYFSIININCLPNFMKFRHCLFKILKNQNVTDGRPDG